MIIFLKMSISVDFSNNGVSGNFYSQQGDQKQLPNLGDYSNLTQLF